MNPSGKIALVTGAGSGIGKETALALARAGAKLLVCDMNLETAQQTADEVNAISECLRVDKVDVSDRDGMRAYAESVHADIPAVDILINNAGVGLAGEFLATSLEDWDWIIGINLMGVVHGCHFFVPKMVERGQGGHVCNVSSLLGYWVAPEVIGYATAKHGVLGLTECLRQEMRPHGIGVSTICPGIINTNIINTSRIVGKDNSEDMRAKVNTSYNKRNYGPDKVAEGIVKAIRSNRGITPVSPESWLMYYVNRLCVPLSRYIARSTTESMQR